MIAVNTPTNNQQQVQSLSHSHSQTQNQPSPPPFMEFGAALADFEEQLHTIKNIYDFRITREQTKDHKDSILLFKIRYNDYISPNIDQNHQDFILSQTKSIAQLAKAVGYAASVLDFRRISNEKFIAYKLL